MSCKINCVHSVTLEALGEIPKLEPYGDISGIGVVIGFLTPAYLCLIIITFFYVFEHDPEIDPYRSAKAPTQVAGRPNPIDQMLCHWFHPQKKSYVGRSYREDQLRGETDHLGAFTRCVLSLADIQIVAGLSILISGYIALPRCLPLYHWQMVVLLAWFSTITHLCALTFLRNHFYTHSIQRSIRLFLMVVVLSLLIVALVPLSDLDTTPGKYGYGDPYWSTFDGEHALCYFGQLNEWKQLGTFTTHFAILLYGTVARAVKLYPTRAWGGKLRSWLAYILRKPMRMARDRAPVEKTAFTAMVRVPLLAAYIVARFYLDLFISMVAEIFFLYFAVAWGTHRMLYMRSERGPEDENTWTFGQVAPVILLLSPIFAILDTVSPLFKPSVSIRENVIKMCRGSIPKPTTIFSSMWTLITDASYKLKVCVFDFPLWSQALRDRRLRYRNQSIVESNERITAILDPARPYDTSPLWYGYLFSHGVIQWVFAVFVIIKGGLSPLSANNYDTSFKYFGGILSYTQLITMSPSMMFVFLWVCYLAEIYVWGTATVMFAFLGTIGIVISAYPWWDSSTTAELVAQAWPQFIIGAIAVAYLIVGLLGWLGISSCISLMRRGFGKLEKSRTRREGSETVELAENDQCNVSVRLLGSQIGSSSAPDCPSTSGLEHLGNGRAAQTMNSAS